MKEQYVGDENDYRKYALLRQFADAGGLRIGVCWMLTPADDRSDGGKTTYLEQPDRWRADDPDIFDLLKLVRGSPGVRRLKLIERSGIIPRALFFNEHLSDRTDLRDAFFRAAWTGLKRADLIFFDPDNGVEVNSKPKGNSGSSKFIYRDEIAEAYRRGHSILVYQHFPRLKPREAFISELGAALVGIAPGAQLWCFRTPFAAFLLLMHPDHETRLTGAAEGALENWHPRFIQGGPLQGDGAG